MFQVFKQMIMAEMKGAVIVMIEVIVVYVGRHLVYLINVVMWWWGNEVRISFDLLCCLTTEMGKSVNWEFSWNKQNHWT